MRAIQFFLLALASHPSPLTAFASHPPSSSSPSSSSSYGSSSFLRRSPSGVGVYSSSELSSTSASQTQSLSSIVNDVDPEVAAIIGKEERRQRRGLELIASENFASAPVRAVLSSCLTNKYSEGSVGARYYGGNAHIDELESLCKSRALSAFGLSPSDWGVNVQPYSGSPANFAVYTGLLEPHDRIMGLDLPSGGHLTHGYYTEQRKVSATSVYFTSLPYGVDKETGLIDYDGLEASAKVFRPKLIIAGGSAYPREWDYKRMREIADEVGALLMTDMAHISGLVAAGEVDSPFACSDVVTTTTHKSLRGPRSGMIFARKELMDRIDFAVFPGLQGGPHNNQIGALAVALKESATPAFAEYASRVVRNARALAARLVENGMTVATGGTDNHLVLWDLRPRGLTGSKAEKVLEACDITVNKNSLVGDKSAVNPGGVRLGVCALTSRGMDEAEMVKVADMLCEGVEIAEALQEKTGKKLKDFVQGMEGEAKIEELRERVVEFAEGFHMPGAELL